MELSHILNLVFYGLMISSLLLTTISAIYYKKQKMKLAYEFHLRMEIYKIKKNNVTVIPQVSGYEKFFPNSFPGRKRNRIQWNYKKTHGFVWTPEFRIDPK